MSDSRNWSGLPLQANGSCCRALRWVNCLDGSSHAPRRWQLGFLPLQVNYEEMYAAGNFCILWSGRLSPSSDATLTAFDWPSDPSNVCGSFARKVQVINTVSLRWKCICKSRKWCHAFGSIIGLCLSLVIFHLTHQSLRGRLCGEAAHENDKTTTNGIESR